MAKYKLLGGRFTDFDENGEEKKYTKGMIVESDRDLDLLYVNKFQKLDGTDSESEIPGLIDLKPRHYKNGMYDVINTVTGKKINEAYLTKDQAYQWCSLDPDKSEEIENEQTEEEKAEAEEEAAAKATEKAAKAKARADKKAAKIKQAEEDAAAEAKAAEAEKAKAAGEPAIDEDAVV